MAINRADILSRQFELPQPVEQAATARASAPAAPTMDSKYFGIPDPAEGLQWTDNTAELANRYYQRLAGIDQFAKSMWLNNKIDVTKPDYSNPQSIAASQAYQQELGNIMAIADELKQGAKALEADRARKDVVINEQLALSEPNKGYASFLPSEQRTYVGFDEAFKAGAQQASGARESRAIMNAEQSEFLNKVNSLREYAQSVRQSNPQLADYYEGQANQMIVAQNQYLNPPAAPLPSPGFEQAASTFSEIANTLRGRHRSFQSTTRTKNGATVFESFANPLVQAGIASKVETYVDEKGEPVVEIVPKDPNRPRIIVDQKNGDALMSEAATALGHLKEYKEFKETAKQMGKGIEVPTEVGSVTVIPLTRMTTDEGNQFFQSNILPLADKRKVYSEIRDKVRQDILALKIPGKLSWVFGSTANPEIIYDTNPQSELGGGKIKVLLKKKDDGSLYYAVSTLDPSGKQLSSVNATTPEDVIKLIQDKGGVIDNLVSQAKSIMEQTPTNQQAQPTTSQTDW